MRGQCIDLPPDSAPWLHNYVAVNEQSISLRCLWYYQQNEAEDCFSEEPAEKCNKVEKPPTVETALKRIYGF